MDFNNSVFNNEQKQGIQIPSDCQVVFVSDMFIEDYVGGAELTTEALIESSPFKTYKLHSSQVTLENLEQGHQKHWIFWKLFKSKS